MAIWHKKDIIVQKNKAGTELYSFRLYDIFSIGNLKTNSF